MLWIIRMAFIKLGMFSAIAFFKRKKKTNENFVSFSDRWQNSLDCSCRVYWRICPTCKDIERCLWLRWRRRWFVRPEKTFFVKKNQNIFFQSEFLTKSFHRLIDFDFADWRTPTTARQRADLICSNKLLNVAILCFQWISSAEAKTKSKFNMTIFRRSNRRQSTYVQHHRLHDEFVHFQPKSFQTTNFRIRESFFRIRFTFSICLHHLSISFSHSLMKSPFCAILW